MYKLLICGLVVMTSLLLVGGIYYPEASFMWLASTSTESSLLRLGMLAALFVLLFSNPPRSIYARTSFGIFSIMLFGVTVASTLGGSTNLLDMLVYAQMSVILQLEALEYSVRPQRTKHHHYFVQATNPS